MVKIIGQSLQLVTLKFMLVAVHLEQTSGMLQNEFRDESNNCRCLGDTLTFECTVTNRLGIIWRGSAFNCDNRNNEMLLYRTSQASECNNGMISGRIVRLKDTSYTSQLDVTLRSDLIGKIVECAGNNGTDSEIAISNTTLDILPFPPPDAIFIALVNFGLKEITFTWNPVAPDCPAIHYNILASNCGSCPKTTNHTTVTCTDVHNGSMCMLAVQTVVCGNITALGSLSKPLIFNMTRTLNEMTSSKEGCIGAMASASIFAIGLTISTIVFTSIIIILVKAKKTARRTVLATQSRARLSRHEEQNPVSQQPRRITATSESRANTTIYDDDMDYEMAKMAVMATNKNIAYEGVYAKEHVYAQIH